MTEEAFIRAILDAPGHDAPRLAYADWLDAHDAPARAAYLRAELAAVGGNGDTAAMRELAAALDPVWVARVTMPPFGVCLADDELVRCGSPVTAADIDATEARLGITFPADYRAFLLNYNGGVLRRVWGTVDGEVIPDDNDATLYPLSGTDAEHVGVEQIAARNWALLDNPTGEDDPPNPATVAAHRDLLSVGWSNEGCAVFLAVRGLNAGTVYLADILGTDFPDRESLADQAIGRSFAEFLARYTGVLPMWWVQDVRDNNPF